MTTNALDKITSTDGATGNNFSNYLSGVSNMIQPITSDIMGVYNAYNPKIQTPLINNTNVANYNELANLGPAYMDMSGYQKMSAKDIFIDSQLIGAAEGASVGMAFGPWGALGGAISGNVMHLWKDLAHNNAGMDKYRSQVNSFNTRQLQNFNQNLNSSYDRLNYDYMKNQKVNYAAFGGNLFTQNSGPFTEINNGGSHEENPYGGIPQGIGSNGKQNLVEQGEVKYNNFVFSKRVYPTKEVLAQFKIPVKYFGLSAADIAKKFNIEAKERPSDPISNTGQDTMLNRLQQAQEYQKVVNEAEKNGMTPEQYMQAMQQQPQEQQNSFAYGGPKDPPVANYSVVNSNDETSKSSSNGQGLFDNIIESYPVLNPKNWGVEDFSHHQEFNNAYEDARTKGLQEFMWNGKRYNTQNSGTPTQQYSMYGNVNAQVNSEVSDKTATRIFQNSLTHNGVDPELLERNFTINTLAGFPEYENTALSPLDSRLYNMYLNDKGLPNIPYTDKDHNTYKEEVKKRSMYNMITGNITGKDYIAEEAHGYQGTQYKENNLVTMAKYWINNPFFTEEQQYKIYDDPNSYEYDAHTIVEPVLLAYQNGDISKDEIPIYIKNMQQHKEEAFLWQPYTLGDRHYQRNLILQSKLRDMGANLREDHDGVIGENTLRALKQYQTAINNNQPVRFTYFDKDELVNINYKNASELDKILIEKELSNYGFDAKTPGASGFSEEAVQKRLEMFKKLYEAVPGKTEELIPVQPQYNATPNKYGKPKKNITKSNGTREYKGFNNSVNSFAEGGLMDGPGDPPVVADATRVQTNNIPYNHPVNQKYAAEAFIKEYIKQIAYLSPAQIAEFNKTLNAAEMAVVKQLPQDALYEAKNKYLDSQVGTITPGKNYNAAQDWWRDFTQTQKGQEIVKFINDPIINIGAAAVGGGIFQGVANAQILNQYGLGNISGTEALGSVGAMLMAGKVLNQFAPQMSGEVAFMGNQMKRQAQRGVQIAGKAYQYNMAQNKQPVFTPNKPTIKTGGRVKENTTAEWLEKNNPLQYNKSISEITSNSTVEGKPWTMFTPNNRPNPFEYNKPIVPNTKPTFNSNFGNPLFEGSNKTGYANWLEKNQPVPKYLRSPFGKGKSSPIPKEVNYSKRIANAFTAAVPTGVFMGWGIDNNKQQQRFDFQKANRIQAVHLIENKIQEAVARKDDKATKQAVAQWKEAVKQYGLTDYITDPNSVASSILKNEGIIDGGGKPVGVFNTTKINQPQPFIPPILKNHKVVKVDGNETTFDNGVMVFTTDNGNYVLNHTISKGTRQTIYNSNNELLSDDWYDSNDKYLGTHEDVVKSWTNQTKPTKTTQNNNTSNGGQSYSGGTQKSLNYTPIDYNSELGKQYMQRYNSVGNDWNRLWTDWKQANPNSTYSLEQFKALAHDNKYGPVHQFINGYNQNTGQSQFTPVTIDPTKRMSDEIVSKEPVLPELGLDMTPEYTTTEEEENQSNAWNNFREAATFFNPARLAPLFNDMYNLYNQEGADPTLANSIRGAYTPIQAEQFGQAMSYDPYDWRANEISQRAKAQSAQQAMMNIAGGNTAAATANLALQNAINQGDIAANYRQGIEYNNANRANVLNFNNQLDQANSMNRQQVNQYNNTNYMNSIVNSAQVWDQEKKLIEQTRGQNQNMLAQNLGGLGQDYVSYNMIQNNPYLLYSMFGRYKGQN